MPVQIQTVAGVATFRGIHIGVDFWIVFERYYGDYSIYDGRGEAVSLSTGQMDGWPTPAATTWEIGKIKTVSDYSVLTRIQNTSTGKFYYAVVSIDPTTLVPTFNTMSDELPALSGGPWVAAPNLNGEWVVNSSTFKVVAKVEDTTDGFTHNYIVNGTISGTTIGLSAGTELSYSEGHFTDSNVRIDINLGTEWAVDYYGRFISDVVGLGDNAVLVWTNDLCRYHSGNSSSFKRTILLSILVGNESTPLTDIDTESWPYATYFGYGASLVSATSKNGYVTISVQHVDEHASGYIYRHLIRQVSGSIGPLFAEEMAGATQAIGFLPNNPPSANWMWLSRNFELVPIVVGSGVITLDNSNSFVPDILDTATEIISYKDNSRMAIYSPTDTTWYIYDGLPLPPEEPSEPITGTGAIFYWGTNDLVASSVVKK